MYNHTNKDSIWGRQKSRMFANKLLNGLLPENAVIHHVNGDQSKTKDIVICQNSAYHKYLHERLRALKMSGDKNKRRCKFCKIWDDQNKLYRHNSSSFHPSCMNEYNRKRRLKNKLRIIDTNLIIELTK